MTDCKSTIQVNIPAELVTSLNNINSVDKFFEETIQYEATIEGETIQCIYETFTLEDKPVFVLSFSWNEWKYTAFEIVPSTIKNSLLFSTKFDIKDWTVFYTPECYNDAEKRSTRAERIANILTCAIKKSFYRASLEKNLETLDKVQRN